MTTTFCPSCAAPWPPGAIGCPSCGRAAGGPTAFGTGPDGGGAGRRLSRTAVAIVAGAVLGVAGIVGVLALRDRLADDSHGNHASSPACDGEPVDGAPAYDAGSGAASIVVLDGRSGSWDARGESEATADLVVCRTWNAEPVRTTWCDYRDDRNGEQFYVEVGYHRAALVVREARTGAVVGEHEVVAADESCPVNMAALIESGERRTSKNLYPEDEVRAVVDGYRASDTA